MKLSARSVFLQVFEELQMLNEVSTAVSRPLRESVEEVNFTSDFEMPNLSRLVKYREQTPDRLSISSAVSTSTGARRTHT